MEKNNNAAISLDTARKMAYVVDRYMVRVLKVLNDLKACTVTFDAEKVMHVVSSDAWVAADGRDADHLELVEEARASLVPFLVEKADRKVLEVRPFFTSSDSLAEGLRSALNKAIWYVDDKAYKKINERVSAFKDVGEYVAPPPATGLLSDEECALVGVHRRHVLGAINVLRDLSTGWRYVEGHLAREYGKKQFAMEMAPEFEALASDLRTLLTLPAFPPAADYYFSGNGSSSESVNTLKSLTPEQVDVLLAL